ncbi:LytR/AlgR family response regulator transcription factor [Enterococcus pallens]|uniref:Response regulatory domain-containing protein n=1 Tax=Enterococcus pallens ATCC BAA-351 TaxID=1158607 RepID=R2QER8_9ENTE|nr:LytTR family DNA-binding domain-containing protein [Enterococcus pallens]EOH93743.1 hypothetical protein UAU_02439 [Enterococcus pallens ATCC BAA-351]EOU24583.1 hypothetical protein I588_00570 [Enterococcus pallens ATCC BAA-351]OJG79594.1 hypothetical protein RV10_GL000721 [Enterococcus pallens]
MNVVICDDDPIFCQKLEKLVNEVFKQGCECEVFYSSERLLHYLEENPAFFQLYLLDIEMPGLDGLQMAKLIRKRDTEALLVFVTNHEEEMPNAFDVRAFHYLVKPLDVHKATEVLFSAERFFSKKRLLFRFVSRKQFYSLFVSQIEYFESAGRKIRIHTQDQIIHEYYDTLDEVEQKIETGIFARIHKSYLVNMEFLQRVENKRVLLQCGRVLAISRKYHGHFHQMYRRHLLQYEGMEQDLGGEQYV